ncbi:MAG: lysophospholipid acyltransferase family protein [Candidatus Omnitrophica bacterium]|nr:lysophospholipid acyltransferase family protein [Candidatus Omnitrophota bacterium]MDD5310668.1 lysophospholipid acyltransferase family protein [Candidatus Omnitrophota bacterium]MDD5545672.1 lysophospholipid acyltransferase family protein [Candidatus Omnitrophota bacterium]
MREFLIYRLGQFLAMALPLKAAYFVAAFFARLQYALSRKDRLIVYGNLRAIFPDEEEKEIARLAKEVFVNFAKYLADFFRFEKVDKRFLAEKVKVMGRENLDGALKMGKGVIALSAHIGNYELGGAVISLLGYRLNVVALDHDNKLINDFFIGQRARTGVQVISVKSVLRNCFEALKKGEVLALLGDRDFSKHGIITGFFGKKTLIPKGPAAFSVKTGAPIVPGFLFRMPDDTFELRFDKPISYRATGDREADEKEVTGLCVKVIEDYIRRYPSQWYMFRRFWL